MSTKRPYLAETKKVADQFKPMALVYTSAKCAILNSSMSLLVELNHAIEEEDAGREVDWNQIKDNVLDRFGLKLFRSINRSVIQTVTLRLAEGAAIKKSSARAADKLIKSATKSAVRKWSKYGRVGAASRMVKTGALSNALTQLSMTLVELTALTVRFIRKHIRRQQRTKRLQQDGASPDMIDDDEDLSFQSFIKQSAKIVVRGAGGVLFCGVGAAAGTLVKPGVGTMAGVLVGDSVMFLLLP